MDKTGIKPQTFDEGTLRAKVVEAIAANPKAVADFKSGQDRGGEQDQGRGDEGEQGRTERPRPAACWTRSWRSTNSRRVAHQANRSTHRENTPGPSLYAFNLLASTVMTCPPPIDVRPK